MKRALLILIAIILMFCLIYKLHDRTCAFEEVLTYHNVYDEGWLFTAQYGHNWIVIRQHGFFTEDILRGWYEEETHECLDDILNIDIENYNYIVCHGCELLELDYNLLKFSAYIFDPGYYLGTASTIPCEDRSEVHIYRMDAFIIEHDPHDF